MRIKVNQIFLRIKIIIHKLLTDRVLLIIPQGKMTPSPVEDLRTCTCKLQEHCYDYQIDQCEIKNKVKH